MILQSVLRIWQGDVIGRFPASRDHTIPPFFRHLFCRFQNTIKTQNGERELPSKHNTQIRWCFLSMVYPSAEPIFVWLVFLARFVGLPTARYAIRTTTIRHTILSRLQTKLALIYLVRSFSNNSAESLASSNPIPSRESFRGLRHDPILHYGTLRLRWNWNMSNRRLLYVATAIHRLLHTADRRATKDLP